MDSSISLEADGLDLVRYVLGQTPAVPVSRLDMVGVLEGVIEKIRPLLRYLPYFKPLAELLNGGILTGCATRRTDIALVKFPEGISEHTKVVEIQILEEGDVTTISTRKSLLLTENGLVLVWSAVYYRPIGREDVCRYTRGRDEVARESRFEIFDGEKLRDASSQNHLWKMDWRKVILKILSHLLFEMTKCIDQREKYLSSMREARDHLEETLRRIQQPR